MNKRKRSSGSDFYRKKSARMKLSMSVSVEEPDEDAVNLIRGRDAVMLTRGGAPSATSISAVLNAAKVASNNGSFEYKPFKAKLFQQYSRKRTMDEWDSVSLVSCNVLHIFCPHFRKIWQITKLAHVMNLHQIMHTNTSLPHE